MLNSYHMLARSSIPMLFVFDAFRIVLSLIFFMKFDFSRLPNPSKPTIHHAIVSTRWIPFRDLIQRALMLLRLTPRLTVL